MGLSFLLQGKFLWSVMSSHCTGYIPQALAFHLNSCPFFSLCLLYAGNFACCHLSLAYGILGVGHTMIHSFQIQVISHFITLHCWKGEIWDGSQLCSQETLLLPVNGGWQQRTKDQATNHMILIKGELRRCASSGLYAFLEGTLEEQLMESYGHRDCFVALFGGKLENQGLQSHMR